MVGAELVEDRREPAWDSADAHPFPADRTEFEEALHGLAGAVPAAESSQEEDALRGQLERCAIRMGLSFHREYHRRTGRDSCPGFAIDSTLGAWSRGDTDPRAQLREWTRAFVASIDAAHPLEPCERAAAILRSRFREPPAREELALEAGASKSAVNRAFKKRHGMACGEYLTRVRLLWFIDTVRASSSSSSEAAAGTGYTSYHNLSEALRLRTGLTPSQIRGLSEDRLREIRQRLALNEAPVTSDVVPEPADGETARIMHSTPEPTRSFA